MNDENSTGKWLDWIGRRADSIIGATLGNGSPANTASPSAAQPAAKPLTILGLPAGQALLYLGLGVLAIWLAKKFMD